MILLYDTALFFYYILIWSSSLFNKKAQQWIRGRKNWTMLLSEKRKFNEHWIWFHCSSLGEYEDCREIFKQIKKDNPANKTLLTFFSPSGLEAKKESSEFDLIMYLPFDSKRNAKWFLDILRPQSIFFSRSELWFYFLNEIHKRKIPAFLLSLKMNAKSSFLKWPMRKIFAKCFKAFDHIFCQDEITKELLLGYFKISSVSITGNTRFDRVYAESSSTYELPHLEKFLGNSFVIVVGSCLPEDEKNIFDALSHLESSSIRCVIVPHEIDGARIDKIVSRNSDRVIRYTNIELLTTSHSVLYIDFVGALRHLYKYARFAIIGGGFDRIGIHNIIEPAAYGVKTTFGPNHKNYQEALDLLRIGGAIIHRNTSELLEIIRDQLTNPATDALKNKIIEYVKDSTGGSKRIIESIRTQFPGLI